MRTASRAVRVFICFAGATRARRRKWVLTYIGQAARRRP
jgi:hypothetical protein